MNLSCGDIIDDELPGEDIEENSEDRSEED
jgi:hypothetical protein